MRPVRQRTFQCASTFKSVHGETLRCQKRSGHEHELDAPPSEEIHASARRDRTPVEWL